MCKCFSYVVIISTFVLPGIHINQLEPQPILKGQWQYLSEDHNRQTALNDMVLEVTKQINFR